MMKRMIKHMLNLIDESRAEMNADKEFELKAKNRYIIPDWAYKSAAHFSKWVRSVGYDYGHK